MPVMHNSRVDLDPGGQKYMATSGYLGVISEEYLLQIRLVLHSWKVHLGEPESALAAKAGQTKEVFALLPCQEFEDLFLDIQDFSQVTPSTGRKGWGSYPVAKEKPLISPKLSWGDRAEWTA